MHAWHLYVIRLNDDAPVSRDDFINEMAAAGIGTSVHFIPLHLHPYWRDTYGLRPEQFPNATRAFQHVVSLPLYTRMTDADQDRVIRATRSILNRPHRNVVACSGDGQTSGGLTDMLLKRCVDIVLSSLVLMLLSPILARSRSGRLAGFGKSGPVSPGARGTGIPPLSHPQVSNHAGRKTAAPR